MKNLCIAVLILLSTTAWGWGESIETKRAKLLSKRREIQADLMRQQCECKAVAFEFQDKEMTQGCLETYRFMVEKSHGTIADIDKRLDELLRTECSESKNKRFIPVECDAIQ